MPPIHCVILGKFLNLAFPTSETGAIIPTTQSCGTDPVRRGTSSYSVWQTPAAGPAPALLSVPQERGLSLRSTPIQCSSHSSPVTHQQLQSTGSVCVCGICNSQNMLHFRFSQYFSFASVLLPKCLGFHIPAHAPELNPGTSCPAPGRSRVTCAPRIRLLPQCVCLVSARTSIPLSIRRGTQPVTVINTDRILAI